MSSPNVTVCPYNEHTQFRRIVNGIYITGYSISLVTLAAALYILNKFRSLICLRTRIHTNLIVALILNNILWIIWYVLVDNNENVEFMNTLSCVKLYSVASYFMTCCCMWTLCESINVYISVVKTVVDESLMMIYYKLIGWGFPFVIMLTFVLVRYFLKPTIEGCWATWDETILITTIPTLISAIISMVLLSITLKIIMTTQRIRKNQHSFYALLKAIRSGFILTPLFSLHFVLLIIRPDPESISLKVYEVFSVTLTSLQGVYVSVMFCFINNQVIAAVKEAIARRRRLNEAIASIGVRTININTDIAVDLEMEDIV